MRKLPGTGGKGKFYRINVRDKSDFVIFRNHDIGDKGGIERLAGKKANGRWATVTWLIEKTDAHIENGILVGDTEDVKNLLKKIRRKPRLFKGDIFTIKPIPKKTKKYTKWMK